MTFQGSRCSSRFQGYPELQKLCEKRHQDLTAFGQTVSISHELELSTFGAVL